MIELIKYVVSSFAEKPELVDYDIKEDGKTVNVTVTLSVPIAVALCPSKVTVKVFAVQ